MHHLEGYFISDLYALDRRKKYTDTRPEEINPWGGAIMKKYQMKVYPKGLGREVYRVLEICGEDTLMDLCDVILDAFDFIDEHLYEFCIDNGPYQPGNYHRQLDSEFSEDKSADIALDQLRLQKGQKFLLHYDFGDDWMFVITVQKITETNECTSPCILKGKGRVEQYPELEEEWEE